MSISNKLTSFDFDGVFSSGNFHPQEDSLNIILTGRCAEEYEYIYSRLKDLGYELPVYFNTISLETRGNHSYNSRVSSGIHKAKILNLFFDNGFFDITHYEDDPIQIALMKNHINFSLNLIPVNNEGKVKY